MQSSEAFENMKSEMKMFVAVWENRFLENVKLCSEQIPGELKPFSAVKFKFKLN